MGVPAISVNAMQNTLRKNGVPFSPMEKFALTSFAATRNPSMRAQAKEEFSKLDHVTQAKLKKLSKDLVVRAALSTLKTWLASPHHWASGTLLDSPKMKNQLPNTAGQRLSTAAFACLHPWVCLLRTNSTRSSIIGMRANLFHRCKATSQRRQ